MKSRNLVIILFIFSISLLFMIAFLGGSAKSAGNEIFVDGHYDPSYFPRDGSAEHPYETIQYAIDMAEEGDTIYVFGGSYNETLTIDKQLTLMGSIEDGDTFVYYGESHKYTVDITASNVNLTGFFIKDDGNNIVSYIKGALIHIDADDVIINNNEILNSKNGWGIYVDSSDGHLIRGNVIDGTLNGIYMTSSKTNDIVGNTIQNCISNGVNMQSSSNLRFYENEVKDNANGFYGVNCEELNFSKNTITGNSLYGIVLYDSDNGVIKKNLIDANGAEGVYLESSDYLIERNSFENNQIGVNLRGSNCNIIENFFNDSSSTGFYAGSSSDGCIFYYNEFNDNYLSARDQGDNVWYNAELEVGNYWEDYNEIDNYPKDGIGDTPYSKNGILDLYPLGKFLEPPNKPTNPSPVDGKANVGLKITLKAKVSDPDGDSLEVSFYRVHNVTTNEIELLSVVKNVASGSFASCNFNLNFDTAFAWFVNVSDGRLFNLSNIWFFYTRNRPADNDPPVPIMEVSSTSITEGDSVTFDASDSYDPDPKGKIEFYRWNFGDNTSEIISVNPIHIFEKAGVYKTYLTVIDNFGTSAQTSVTINVEKDETGGNLKPVANISGPTSAKTGNTLTFDGSDSYDPDDTDKIDNYLWDFGDGTTIEGKSELTVQHTYNLVKTHTVTLTITDDEGSSDTETFEVKIEKASSSSEGSPGFEIILLIISISLVLFYKKRKK